MKKTFYTRILCHVCLSLSLCFSFALGVSVKKVAAWEHEKAVPDEAEMEKIKHITAGL